MLLTPDLLFVHMPKTGGTWTSAMIRRSGVPWCNLRPVHHYPDERLRAVLPDRLIFTTVRHPVDWWRSLWNFARATGWPPLPSDWNQIVSSPPEPDFDDFITRIADRYPGFFGEMVSLYTTGADVICRTENLHADVTGIFTKVGYQFPDIPPRNTGDYSDVPPVSQYARQLIEDAEKAVISRFYPDAEPG